MDLAGAAAEGRAEPRRRRLPATLAGDVSGGLTGGIASAAANIPAGLIACAPMGAALAGTGTLSIFYGAICAGSVFIALGRTVGLQAGGTMPVALVAAGAVASLASQRVLSPGVDGPEPLLAIIMVLTVLTGLFTLGLSLTGLGRLVPLIPYPVIAGLINSSAVLMVLAQYGQAIGLEPGAAAPAWPHPGALAVSAATFLLMSIPIRRLRIVPSALLALLGGSAVHYALAALAPSGFVGRVLGPVPFSLAHAHNVAGAWAALPGLPVWPVLGTLAPAALSIAVLCTLDTLMGASALQDASGRHHSAEPDLRAIAAGNVCAGLFGTLPVTAGANASMLVWSTGGRTKLAGFIRAAVLLLVIAVLPAALAGLPLAVVAGVVLSAAWRLADRESLGFARLALRPGTKRRGELAGNLLVVLVVMAAAVFQGMAAAVLAGGVLSLLLFAMAMAQSAVRRGYTRPAGRSRTARPRTQTDILRAHGTEIEVVELQGALFFGSADQVAQRVEAALARGARHVILDMRRVTAVDLSGARRLVQVAERFWAAGTDLALAHIRRGGPVATYLGDVGLLHRLRADRLFNGLEEAVQQAETRILTAAGAGAERSLSPEEALEAAGLPAEAAAALAPRLPRLRVSEGDALIRAGEASGEFFILLEGVVDVTIAVPAASGEPGRTRVSTLTAGLMVGEMAYVSGAQRTADVTARTPVTCLRIDAGTVEALRQTEPDIAYDLICAIARQLERNLRTSTATLVTFEE